MRKSLYILYLALLLIACGEDDGEVRSRGFVITSVSIGLLDLSEDQLLENVPIDQDISISFSTEVRLEDLQAAITLRRGTEALGFTLAQSQGLGFVITPSETLRANTSHHLNISADLVSPTGASFPGASFSFKTQAVGLQLLSVTFGGKEALDQGRVTDVPRSLDLNLTFSATVDMESLSSSITIGRGVPLVLTQLDPANEVSVSVDPSLPPISRFVLSISDNLVGANGEGFPGYAQELYTEIDPTFKFPEVTDEELLTLVQEQTFKYFWDFAHPTSGLARERNTSGDLVTIGGSGFGVMAILVGIERGFITRQEGVDRLETIVNFLETADRFHGAWPHWMNGITGETIPFDPNDDGADLVETAFMIQGLLAARQFLNAANAQELAIKNKITDLWEAVEWSWFTQNGQDVLYWHWSPNVGWEKNLQISGWNESLIVYVLAAASPTYPIDVEVYHNGWARAGGMKSGEEFYEITLPLGPQLGGPLFFSHYSFLGLDPRQLEDQYANYWTQNINHTRINRAYCIDNPLDHVGYSADCWGLTASDSPGGYSAHSPANDLGVITPTAAISSFPYTPVESMEATRHFYYLLGDRLWGEYGFYDAFILTENWTADSYLAIDQGPIIIMIENHRTGLLWELFMDNNEIVTGLEKLGFTSY